VHDCSVIKDWDVIFLHFFLHRVPVCTRWGESHQALSSSVSLFFHCLPRNPSGGGVMVAAVHSLHQEQHIVKQHLFFPMLPASLPT
jgi:hypothetical protein